MSSDAQLDYGFNAGDMVTTAGFVPKGVTKMEVNAGITGFVRVEPENAVGPFDEVASPIR